MKYPEKRSIAWRGNRWGDLLTPLDSVTAVDGRVGRVSHRSVRSRDLRSMARTILGDEAAHGESGGPCSSGDIASLGAAGQCCL